MRIPAGWFALALGLVCVVAGTAEQPLPIGSGFGPSRPGDAVATSSPHSASPHSAGSSSVFAENGQVSSDSAVHVGAAGELIGFSGFNGSGSQTITLVHTGKMQMAVYHIDRSGQIALISSRPIDADFSLSLNVTAPLPGEIRLLSGQVK